MNLKINETQVKYENEKINKYFLIELAELLGSGYGV